MIYPVSIFHVGEGDTKPGSVKLQDRPGYYVELEDSLLEMRYAEGLFGGIGTA